ncbi:hypothetical protein HJG60_010947 [Phyllostomus discolor]|uniref:L1 transposable element RRM domain-containing protein n=1 Tax=Phyllostomus discolor TaxID=89673 RepID=A0A834AF16_9CHIR|nr:hypothetical protein HJG60_010947 [Phyllostomus discolor]
MKEQIKATEKIQINDEEIANLSDVKFKTLVIRVITELIEYGCKIEEKVKVMKSEIQENVLGTNSDGKETRTQINDSVKEDINLQPEQKEETRIQKNEESLRKVWGNLKYFNISIIGMPEREEEEQEIENLFEQIIKENFPNLAKEIDFQEVQKAQRVPKKLDPRKHTPRHITITLAKIKDKER